MEEQYQGGVGEHRGVGEQGGAGDQGGGEGGL